jgi:pantoate--beta-alanine ligase
VELIRTVEWMKQAARQAQADGRVTGLVPTMGALHAGHLSLVQAARRETSPVVVSIFVNPKQFGPHEDFTKYPRAFEADRELLEQAGADILFAPSVEEMYPPGFRTFVNVEGLSERLEGRIRPGHFRGVATVVLRLFEIVSPRFAYFGRKDAQQERIIRQMASDLALDTEIVACPIVREADGLAMSSRNRFLTPAERAVAPRLYATLQRTARGLVGGAPVAETLQSAREALGRDGLRVDYLALVDGLDLVPIDAVLPGARLIAAARLGTVRLLDNIACT